MKKKNILPIVIVVVLLLANFSLCAAAQPAAAQPAAAPKAEDISAQADKMTENILQAMNDGKYARYTKDFDEKMKQAATEAKFKELNAQVKANLGKYVSKQYVGSATKDQYTVMIYKAKYSLIPGDVIVKNVFSIVDGKLRVSGFWLEAPKPQK